jgi:LysM repeat protein
MSKPPALPCEKESENLRMMICFRKPVFLLIGSILLIATQSLKADESVKQELVVLRQLIEKQSSQIEQLSLEVGRLRQQLAGSASTPAPAAAVAPIPAAVPVAATNEFAPNAAPVTIEPLNVHIVVKGESLDSIAKLHKTTIAELQRLNKITDPKKLQIGQSLLLPQPPKPQ